MMMILDGGERQIGQSKSSLSCSSKTSFLRSAGLLDASKILYGNKTQLVEYLKRSEHVNIIE